MTYRDQKLAELRRWRHARKLRRIRWELPKLAAAVGVTVERRRWRQDGGKAAEAHFLKDGQTLGRWMIYVGTVILTDGRRVEGVETSSHALQVILEAVEE